MFSQVPRANLEQMVDTQESRLARVDIAFRVSGISHTTCLNVPAMILSLPCPCTDLFACEIIKAALVK